MMGNLCNFGTKIKISNIKEINLRKWCPKWLVPHCISYLLLGQAMWHVGNPSIIHQNVTLFKLFLERFSKCLNRLQIRQIQPHDMNLTTATGPPHQLLPRMHALLHISTSPPDLYASPSPHPEQPTRPVHSFHTRHVPFRIRCLRLQLR